MMFYKILNHLPVLQIIIPMFGVLLIAIFNKINISNKLAIVAAALNLIISILIGLYINSNAQWLYAFGDWQPPIGIEFRLDYLNYFVTLIINIIFLLFFLFGQDLLNQQIFSNTLPSKHWVIYALLLINQLGLLGMSSTNDLFNLYVFIELTSLSTYGLLSLGQDRRAVIGAFNYLTIGTIAATFILIAIGLILATTGSLNISDIKSMNNDLYNNRIFLSAIAFYIVGNLLKIALMPLHAWLVNAYSYAAPIIVAQLAGLSSLVGFYIMLRFIFYVIDYNIVYQQFNVGIIFELGGLLSIIIGSVLTILQDSPKKIVIYSGLAQTGYILLCLSFNDKSLIEIAIIYLIADVFLKTILFYAIAIFEYNIFLFRLNSIFGWLLCLNIMSNTALPPSVYFFNKLNLLHILISKNHFLSFVVITIASIISLFYNYKLFYLLFFKYRLDYENQGQTIESAIYHTHSSNRILFYALNVIYFLLIVFYIDLSRFAASVTKTVF